MKITKIANSKSERCGSMICKTCKKEIEGDYLIVEHYISKRGNEDDYNELFCYECSKHRKAWKEYFKNIELEEKRKAGEHSKNIEKAIEMIKKSSCIEFDYTDCGEKCIIIS
jgi:hypothetical protein